MSLRLWRRDFYFITFVPKLKPVPVNQMEEGVKEKPQGTGVFEHPCLPSGRLA